MGWTPLTEASYCMWYCSATIVIWSCTAAPTLLTNVVELNTFDKNTDSLHAALPTSGNRVLDLKVISTDRMLRTVILTWTATTHATFYDIRYHPDPSFLQTSFEQCFKASAILGDSLGSTENPGDVQILTVQLPKGNETLPTSLNAPIYFALRILDAQGRATDVSNIASAEFNRSTSYYRNVRYERIIGAMVLTSVVLSIAFTTAVLILCKLGRRYNNNVLDYQGSYYNHTEFVSLADDQVSLHRSYSRKQSLTPTNCHRILQTK